MNRREYQKIIRAGNSRSTLYFDCFDTLLFHRYSPLHFFIRLSDWLKQTYFVQGDLIRLAKSLELLFPIQSPLETTARNIYFHYIKSDVEGFSVFFEKVEKTISIILRDLFVPAPFSQKLIKYISETGNTKIFVVTDFYLGARFLKPILESFFGKHRFRDIVCSADYGCRKGTSLYQVAAKLGGDGLVIDDSYECCKKARSLFSIKPVWINAQSQHRHYKRFNLHYNRFIKHQCTAVWNNEAKTFSSNFAFVLFDYCQRLYANVRFGENIAFFSREGLFLKRCFDEYLLSHQDKRLTDSYFLISRLAMLLPTLDLKTVDAEGFAKEFKSRCEWEDLSVFLVLQTVGFDDKEICSLSQECQCDFQEVSKNVFSQRGYHELWKLPSFKTLLQEKQRFAIQRLSANIGGAHGKRFVLAELGFRGRMQNELSRFVPKNIDILGLYFGLTGCIGEFPHSQKRGLLFEYQQGDYAEFQTNMYVLEPLLRADHGQVACYLENRERFIADSGVAVFNSYSQARQTLMLEAFKTLCEINETTPIPPPVLLSFGIKALQKRPHKCRQIDEFYGRFQCYGGINALAETHYRKRTIRGFVRLCKNKIKIMLHKIRILLHWF